MKLGVDRVLRNQFNRVAISAGGQIILESKKLHHWSLLPNAALDRLILARTTTLPDAEKRNLDFKPLLKTSAPPDSRVGLRTAECGASIRIFVDSRGMLHVKPKQKGALEFSFVLCDTEVAGWCSDGTVAGTQYFVGEDTTSVAPSVFLRKLLEVTRHSFDPVI